MYHSYCRPVTSCTFLHLLLQEGYHNYISIQVLGLDFHLYVLKGYLIRCFGFADLTHQLVTVRVFHGTRAYSHCISRHQKRGTSGFGFPLLQPIAPCIPSPVLEPCIFEASGWLDRHQRHDVGRRREGGQRRHEARSVAPMAAGQRGERGFFGTTGSQQAW